MSGFYKIIWIIYTIILKIKHLIFFSSSYQSFCEVAHMQSVHQESFGKYKNCNLGKDIVIVGAGPTLQYYEPINSAIHIGVNRTYKLQDKIKFDFMFAHDYANGESKTMIQNISKMDCEKFFGITFGKPMVNRAIPECMTLGVHRYFISTPLNKMIYPDIRFYPLMDFHSVIFPAIHFALFTNPKRIYLVGCDVSHHGHFDTKNVKILDKNIDIMKIGYERVKEFVELHYPDTEIISINPVGLKGLFIDKYTKEFSPEKT